MRPVVMNKTEAAFQLYLKALDDIAWIGFEAIKFMVGVKTCYYTPDFITIGADGAVTAWEVKGFWRDDARVKIKVAAEMYPFRFMAAKQLPKKSGGGWEYEVFGSVESASNPTQQGNDNDTGRQPDQKYSGAY